MQAHAERACYRLFRPWRLWPLSCCAPPNALAGMNDEDLRVVVSHMQLVTFPAGRIMVQEGNRKRPTCC